MPAVRTRPQLLRGPPAVVPAAAAVGRAVLPSPAAADAAAPAGITRLGTLTPTAARPASAKRKGNAMDVIPGPNTPAEEHGLALIARSLRRREPPAHLAAYDRDI